MQNPTPHKIYPEVKLKKFPLDARLIGLLQSIAPAVIETLMKYDKLVEDLENNNSIGTP